MEYLDMLAKLGIGNAHPGGFTATLKQLEQYPLPMNSRILEVGCGTGRTSCYLAAQGHDVTGIDIRSDMISKAIMRANEENVSAVFLEGDACSLPFESYSFDVILVESVSIFVDTAKALTEYYRVLRTGGKVYDREMVQIKPMPKEIYDDIALFFQIGTLWNYQDWSQLVNKAAFKDVQIEGPFLFPKISEDLLEHPDHHQHIDAGSFYDTALWEVTNKYNSIMERYHEYMGSIHFMGTK
ncbi:MULTISPECIES: class I SAM-dependent methyltransferase [unclassified Paenibacillus]|uniref:class I SAM-dependent methyltransferase n=1 Tax=unclassified Paenibacillus TaxID=185978 RepID=UPI0036428156